MSIHKISDGLFLVRWREGGRNKSLRVRGSAMNWRGRSNERRCLLVMRTDIWMLNGKSTTGCQT